MRWIVKKGQVNMSEKNGNVKWTQLLAVVGLILTACGLFINAQINRDGGQDKRIETLEKDCKDIPALITHIEYIRKSVDEIKRKVD
jgi:hypothetical protein